MSALASTITLDSEKNVVSEEQLKLITEKLPYYCSLNDDHEAIEGLLSLEKIARNAQDMKQTTKIVLAIITRDFEKKNFVDLNEHLHMLAKRRSQLKTVILEMTKKALSFIPNMPNDKDKLEVATTLKTLTDGKIFVERECTEIAKILADISERNGNIEAAAKYLQELQIETFGSLTMEEKTVFLLEQVRLSIASNDYIKAMIISNKVNRSFINSPNLAPLKTKFYTLMCKYHLHKGEYIEVSRDFNQLATIKKNNTSEDITMDDPYQYIYKAFPFVPLEVALTNCCVFAILTPFSQEQDDIVQRLMLDKDINQNDKLAPVKQLLEAYLKPELISWKRFRETFKELFCQIEVFSQEKYWNELQERINEHNIRIIAQYYSQIRISRIAQLIELDIDKAEEYISKLVISHDITAKIDRPHDIVRFGARITADSEFQEWTNGLQDLLNAVDDTAHHIHRQLVLHEKN